MLFDHENYDDVSMYEERKLNHNLIIQIYILEKR